MIAPLSVPAFETATEIRHGFFTREGGVSAPPFASLNCSLTSSDAQDKVQENLRRVAQAMGGAEGNLLFAKQVHSALCLVVEEPWIVQARPEVDALVTKRRGLALGILTADCAPVLFVDAQAGVIGAAHAGWRGAVGGVLENTVAKMEKLGARREGIHAAIGPCIGPESYEVDEAFAASFAPDERESFFKGAARMGHLMFDLPAYVKARLEAMGLVSVAPSPADTCADEKRFFSHRRGTLRGSPEEGRMLSCIALVG